ncbi:MAG: YcxB family protein, partial [Bacilli bacterium]|nr:YcxB family protein [Bacilli bacterium]
MGKEKEHGILDENSKVKKQGNKEYLYTCETNLDAFTYKKMVRYFPHIYWSYVWSGTFLNLILSAIVAIMSKSLLDTLAFFSIWQIFMMVYYKLRLEQFAEKDFNARLKKQYDKTIHSEFYEDYFIRENDDMTFKIHYGDIERCIETDTSFYLYYGVKKLVI